MVWGKSLYNEIYQAIPGPGHKIENLTSDDGQLPVHLVLNLYVYIRKPLNMMFLFTKFDMSFYEQACLNLDNEMLEIINYS